MDELFRSDPKRFVGLILHGLDEYVDKDHYEQTPYHSTFLVQVLKVALEETTDRDVRSQITYWLASLLDESKMKEKAVYYWASYQDDRETDNADGAFDAGLSSAVCLAGAGQKEEAKDRLLRVFLNHPDRVKLNDDFKHAAEAVLKDARAGAHS